MRWFLFALPAVICWILFRISFARDRSRYRNCYLLFIAVLSLFPLLLNIPGGYGVPALLVLLNATIIGILIVPFFLIHNGIVMIKREGRNIPQLLSLGLGIVILIGELATIGAFITFYYSDTLNFTNSYLRSGLFIAEAFIAISVFYGSMSFLIYMIYVLFLHVIPRKRDFDYVIIHGAGLLDGDRVSKLLQDRLDKAIEVYRKDPTPPKLIPSGGKGSDEFISEAEAMKRYLLSQGIPETDIIAEDQSTTTYENLDYSKRILDSLEGRKYTALVTSNYHVYRALRYCRKVGLKCTGIGSHVAFYYWPSAMIREYIAIHAEKKHVIIFVLGWLLSLAPLILLLAA